MNKAFLNNRVRISGEIVSEPTFSHETYGETFYTLYIKSNRISENFDTIPVAISERLIDSSEKWTGRMVEVSGQFRSHNGIREGKRRLILSVFAKEFTVLDEMSETENHIYLDGYICKEPIYRKTPLGREIADVLLAVNRPYNRSDYIPCICWGRNARRASRLKVGDNFTIDGRMQSRTYDKKLSENDYEKRTAYEVSVCKLEVMEG